MADQQPILECRNLSVSYTTRSGAVPAVVDFNLKLMPGEAHGVVGESGCGKSTVALAIMNYLGRNGAITGGQILFEGRDLTRLPEEELRQIRGARIAMVYQEPMASLNPSMQVGEQLAEVPIYHEGITRKAALERAEAMLASVRLPDPGRIMRAYPHQISGGQQQRVVISMALLSNPKLLLLDEPTTALDVTVEAGIVDLIREISAKFGTSMLYISHNLGLIRETCQRITVMYSGQAVELGSIGDVFRNMRHPYTRGLFGSIPLPGADKHARPLTPIRGQLPLPRERPPGCSFGPRCDHFAAGRCDAGELPMLAVDVVGDHQTRCIRFAEIDWKPKVRSGAGRAAVAIGDVVLKADRLSKSYEISRPGLLLVGGGYQTIKANQSLDFAAREAETVAIVGESGCGKSTFAKVLMGLEEATSGSLTMGNLELSHLPVQKRDAATIGKLQMIFQNPFDTLNPSHTVGGQIARVIRKFGVESDPKKIAERVDKLLDTVKLPRDFAKRLPRQLSGGQKQRIGIARAFAGNPKVVVADEPVSALDVSVQAAVTELLTDIQRDHRTTMLFISHDLSVVRYLADRIVVMYLGQIMEQGATSQVFAPPYHPYTEALLAAVPIADATMEKRKVVLTGEIPSAANPPKGCPFSTRCPYVIRGTCETVPPPMRRFDNGHVIACHLSSEQLSAMKPVIFSKEPAAIPAAASVVVAASAHAPVPPPVAPRATPVPPTPPAVAMAASVQPVPPRPAPVPPAPPAQSAVAAVAPVVAAALAQAVTAQPVSPARVPPVPAASSLATAAPVIVPLSPTDVPPVRLRATAALAGQQVTPMSSLAGVSAAAAQHSMAQDTATIIATPAATSPRPALLRPTGVAATAALARQQSTAFAVEAAGRQSAPPLAAAIPASASWASRALALLQQHDQPTAAQAKKALDLPRD